MWLNPVISDIDQITASYDKGILPYEGGLLDQPARLMQAIRIYKKAVYFTNEMIDQRKNIKTTAPEGN